MPDDAGAGLISYCIVRTRFKKIDAPAIDDEICSVTICSDKILSYGISMKKCVVIGLLGTTLDTGVGAKRWEKWRPSISLCLHENLLIDRFELLGQEKYAALSRVMIADLKTASPETKVVPRVIEFKDPWDFEEVYAALHDFARGYPFSPDEEDYLVHITTGTHVAQICLFLLTESRHFPARLIQTSPPRPGSGEHALGSFSIIDLDLSRYDRIASRFLIERNEAVSFLKSGIETLNPAFNQMIARIEKVSIASRAPILLLGPTGAGKSRLARRIYELKKSRRQIDGACVEVNCATLRGEGAMSALFGHKKGAFTGAASDRAGLLKSAHKGMLFLDEIGELGLDEQAMLLRALEEKLFLPLGADQETGSDFQMIAGTNRDLGNDVRQGRFREDLLARINLWMFRLPSLRERIEDIEPNLNYELEQYARQNGTRVAFNKEARAAFLAFGSSPEALWSGNFRDLNSAVGRMATLAPGGRISLEIVEEELDRLRAQWNSTDSTDDLLTAILGREKASEIDRFDRVQLNDIIAVCRTCRSLSEAGRQLFSASRQKKQNVNDADRLRKYLARFGLSWNEIV